MNNEELLPIKAKSQFNHHDLVTISQLTDTDITNILDVAEAMKEVSNREVKKIPALRGKTIINYFLEPSTRTRTSFEIGAKRLFADLVNISGKSSSMTKGESFRESLRTLEAMKPDLIVIRSASAGIPSQATKWINCPIVNGGDGRHEHPTQALLDLFTIRNHFGTFEGLKVLIVGDIANSRVARSNLIGMKTLNIERSICSPPQLMPAKAELMADKVFYNLKEAIKGVDVVIALRIQKERLLESWLPSTREYANNYQINQSILKLANRNAILLHPGPVNAGIELDQETIYNHRSLILEQVTNGIAIRMAILFLLLSKH
ncbi:MAG: aspartate carbamoyltransferase catalytic subunit [Nitrospinota bacterium]